MNTFDIAAIVVISFCLLRGLFRGLIGEVSGIIGVVAGFYGAYTYYPMIAVYGERWIRSGEMLNILAFFILFTVIVFAIGLISLLIQKIMKLVFLGWVDRSFGLVFGAAKGILIMSAAFVMLTTFLPKNQAFLRESKLAPYLMQTSKALTVFVNKRAKSDFLKKLEGMF